MSTYNYLFIFFYCHKLSIKDLDIPLWRVRFLQKYFCKYSHVFFLKTQNTNYNISKPINFREYIIHKL